MILLYYCLRQMGARLHVLNGLSEYNKKALIAQNCVIVFVKEYVISLSSAGCDQDVPIIRVGLSSARPPLPIQVFCPHGNVRFDLVDTSFVVNYKSVKRPPLC